MHCAISSFCKLLLFNCVIGGCIWCLFKVFVVLTASMSITIHFHVIYSKFLIVRLALNELKYQQPSHCDTCFSRLTCYCKQDQYLLQMWDKTTQHGSVIIEIADVTQLSGSVYRHRMDLHTDHKTLPTLNKNTLLKLHYTLH